MKFGRFLKSKREEQSLTIDKFAEMCGVSNIYIAHLESGESDAFAEGLFRKMAVVLHMDGDEFIIKSGRIPRWAYKYILKNWNNTKQYINNNK